MPHLVQARVPLAQAGNSESLPSEQQAAVAKNAAEAKSEGTCPFFLESQSATLQQSDQPKSVPRVMFGGCSCALREQCDGILRAVLDHEVFMNLLDMQFDKCYDARDESRTRIDGRPRPIGCARFGVKIEPRRALARNVFSWTKVYHGTKKEFVSSIIKLGYLLKYKDLTEDGEEIGSRDIEKIACADGNFVFQVKIREGRALVADADVLFSPRSFVFTTPSFKYACDEAYAESFEINGRSRKAQVILEFRLRPDSYQKGPQTLRHHVPDDSVDDDMFEFFTARHGVMALTGIIVKPKNPERCSCTSWTLKIPQTPPVAPMQLGCPNAQRRWEVLRRVGINPYFFNHTHDKCYCGCTVLPDHIQEGRRRYVLPKPGTRFALAVDEARIDTQGTFQNWHTCFHGTTLSSVLSVVECGFLLYPGCITMEGKEIKERDAKEISRGRSRDVLPDTPTDTICVSPSVRYATHPIYASPFKIGGVNYRVAFHLKARPDSYDVHPSTVRGLYPEFDPFLRLSEMEWHTRRHGTLALYGIVVLDDHAAD